MNPSKRKGTDAEVRLLEWLHRNDHPEAVRNPPAGSKDVGDLRLPRIDEDIVVEVKSWKDVASAINTGLAELEAEKRNAGTSHGVLVLKRRGTTDPGEWLAVRKVLNDPEIGSTEESSP
jgi:hypothetical protein